MTDERVAQLEAQIAKTEKAITSIDLLIDALSR